MFKKAFQFRATIFSRPASRIPPNAATSETNLIGPYFFWREIFSLVARARQFEGKPNGVLLRRSPLDENDLNSSVTSLPDVGIASVLIGSYALSI